MQKHTAHGTAAKLSNMNYEITLYTTYRKYTSFVKSFQDEKHLNNWTRSMTKKGHKVISIIPVT
jgi:hypothetical protein